MTVFRNRSASTRTALVYTLLIILVMCLFAAALTIYMTRRLQQRTEQELTQQVALLVSSMYSYHAALADNAIKMAAVFATHFPGRFSVDSTRSTPINGRSAPLIRNGSTPLNLNTAIVDRFTAVTGAVGTVFARSGDDFIRVATSLKKEDGSRAIGTLLEKDHPAYQGLLRGIMYVGKAELFGKDYMTSYQPVKDRQGRVIAVLFIGLDFTEHLRALKDKIRDIRIAESGYIFALDAKPGHDYGRLQIHPASEGTNIADTRDSNGRAFIREMLTKRAGIIRYPWLNRELGETRVREKLVAYQAFPEWDWIICAGSWLDELNRESRTLLNATLTAAALVAVILILLFRTMLRMEQRLSGALQQRVAAYQASQHELQLTGQQLQAQVDDYQQTHDRLLATERSLQVQLESAAENSQKFKAVFDNSPITVALTTVPDGTFFEVNQAFIDTFGYEREAVLGKTTTDLGMWLQAGDRERYLQSLRDNGSVHNFETQMRRKDGEIITVLFSGTLLEIAGKPFVLSAVMEITEQKRLQEQLQQSQKMDVVGQLAGGIAHDFNNMLAAILGTAELLQRRMTGDQNNLRMIGTIIEAASRSADLTRDLLAFSRKQQGGTAPVDIHATVNSVMALLVRTIDRRIVLHKHLLAGNPIVYGDQTQLENALLNLGINARDAMPEGGSLTFTTTEIQLDGAACLAQGISLTPGRYLEISVADSGDGMAPETIEHIFEPFFTTKAVGQGTGLGLAAVYGTVTSHGGEVRVQSQPGVGSVFTIYLPLAAAAGHSVPPESQEPVRGSGGILLVDDEAILRAVGRDLLEELGYTVYLAEDGEQALQQYAARYDQIVLVLLDMIMPRMAGKETFLRLRELDPQVRVLFCSGFHREGTAEELVALGARGFIQKPYRRSDLSRAVAAALAN